MKVTKQIAIIISVVICLASVGSAVATFMVSSTPTEAVTTNYSVSISQVRGFNPTFKLYATVTDSSSDGNTYVNNVPVTFYVSIDEGEWTVAGTGHTNSTGVATGSYSIDHNGEVDQFRAEIGIP
jgi:hypothetical protein